MDLNVKPEGSALTRFEILILSVRGIAEMGPSVAKQHWESLEGRSVSSRLGSLFGKGGPSKEDEARFSMTFLSLAVHEVIRNAPRFDAADPHGFQERFVGEVLQSLVADEFKQLFFQAVNENIEALQQHLTGEIDNSQYLLRLCGRFFEDGDLFASLAASAAYPSVVSFVRETCETLETS